MFFHLKFSNKIDASKCTEVDEEVNAEVNREVVDFTLKVYCRVNGKANKKTLT